MVVHVDIHYQVRSVKQYIYVLPIVLIEPLSFKNSATSSTSCALVVVYLKVSSCPSNNERSLVCPYFLLKCFHWRARKVHFHSNHRHVLVASIHSSRTPWLQAPQQQACAQALQQMSYPCRDRRSTWRQARWPEWKSFKSTECSWKGIECGIEAIWWSHRSVSMYLVRRNQITSMQLVQWQWCSIWTCSKVMGRNEKRH